MKTSVSMVLGLVCFASVAGAQPHDPACEAVVLATPPIGFYDVNEDRARRTPNPVCCDTDGANAFARGAVYLEAECRPDWTELTVMHNWDTHTLAGAWDVAGPMTFDDVRHLANRSLLEAAMVATGGLQDGEILEWTCRGGEPQPARLACPCGVVVQTEAYAGPYLARCASRLPLDLVNPRDLNEPLNQQDLRPGINVIPRTPIAPGPVDRN